MKDTIDLAPNEYVINVGEQDVEMAMSYLLEMVSKGFKAQKITDSQYMITFCGRTVYDLKNRKIYSVVRQPD